MGYRRSNVKTLLIDKPKNVLRLILYPKRYITPEKTYYPEKTHKSFFNVFLDQLHFVLKYGYINEEYYIYGLDVKDDSVKITDFVPEKENIDTLLQENRSYILKESTDFYYYNQLCLVRDKLVFSKLMEGFGFPIPKSIGAFVYGKWILNSTYEQRELKEFCNEDCDVLAKPISGNSGKGIIHLIVNNSQIFHKGKQLSVDDLHALVKNDVYLVQEFLANQHPSMKSLFPGSVNTLRVTMARTNNGIKLLGVMCLMGARYAEFSNWHYGGVCVNVKRDGTLDKYGFSFTDKRITKHPDSNIQFDGYKIPYYEEAISVCEKAMNVFYGMKTIGWDIAITDNGPVFIEGNDGWGIAAHQMVEHRGWAKEYHEVFKF